MTTFVLEFKKTESDDETKHSTFNLTLKAKTAINECDINDVSESVKITNI